MNERMKLMRNIAIAKQMQMRENVNAWTYGNQKKLSHDMFLEQKKTRKDLWSPQRQQRVATLLASTNR